MHHLWQSNKILHNIIADFSPQNQSNLQWKGKKKSKKFHSVDLWVWTIFFHFIRFLLASVRVTLNTWQSTINNTKHPLFCTRFALFIFLDFFSLASNSFFVCCSRLVSCNQNNWIKHSNIKNMQCMEWEEEQKNVKNVFRLTKLKL